MSTDKSLKSKGALARHRNVLTRTERIEHLKDVGKWEEDRSPMNLPKVSHRKAAVGKKSKAKKAEGEGAAAETPAAEPKK